MGLEPIQAQSAIPEHSAQVSQTELQCKTGFFETHPGLPNYTNFTVFSVLPYPSQNFISLNS